MDQKELVTPALGEAQNRNEQVTEAEESASYSPEGFDDQASFLLHIREEFELDAEEDRENREQAANDLEFLAGVQWDPDTFADRDAQGRPCLTVNNLPQFVGQVIGERAVNSASVKVIPKHDGSKEVAKVRGDLIRGIEQHSRAVRIYEKQQGNQVACGIGNWRIKLDWEDDDVFVQDIFIEDIPNPLAVIWDRFSTDPTGADAKHCFIVDELSKKAFEKMYPDATPIHSLAQGSFWDNAISLGWYDDDKVRVVEYWRIIEVEREIALFIDGKTRDVTGKNLEEVQESLGIDVAVDAEGYAYTRRVLKKVAEMHLVTGNEILEGPYRLPINRLPVIRAEGRVVETGKRVRFGLIRFAKDPQRLKNYWRSVAAETLAMAPKAQWLAPEDAVEGREEDFREAHITGDPLLIYNKNVQTAPIRQSPPPMPDAILVEARQNSQDMKDVTGLQDASLGIQSNEISGRAINARAQRGAVATSMYHSNLNHAIMETGSVINQLIPLVYDTPRVIRVIGENNEDRLVAINNEFNPDSIDITSGRYDVAITVGPSFATKREEAAEAMLTAVNAYPELMRVAGDLVMKAQDWPMAEELGERIRRTIPKEILGEDAEEASDVEKQQQEAALVAQAQQLAMQQTVAQLEMQKLEAEVAKAMAEAEEAKAQAFEAYARAKKAEAEALEAGVKIGERISFALDKLNQPTPVAGNGQGSQQQSPLSPLGGQPTALKGATNGTGQLL